MQEEIKRMSGIVTQLKDYSKPETRADERVSVDEVLKGYPLKILIKNMKKKGIEFKMDLDAGKCYTRISRNRLIQVLMNLLNNAAESIEHKEKGVISIKTSRIDRNGPHIAIVIVDNGTGIDRENIHRIFEPFFTTKKSEGTGLGLSISYSIVKSYDGEIEVKSDGGSGSEFTVFFREDAP
jgi:C4-dicarboxylate-specific signal transduction histidine kinase